MDIPNMLKQISSNEIFELRRKGRFYLENYLALANSILSAVRYRKNMRSPINLDVESIILKKNQANTTESDSKNMDERLNSSKILPTLLSSMAWNKDPTLLLHDHVSPLKSPYSRTYLESPSELARNHTDIFRDFYTIVILAYKRDAQLKAILKRLLKFRFLDRVIVVWNDFMRDPPPLEWWDPITADIYVINGTKNSLNNRFIPWDLIRTEAVFSMDEDYEANNENLFTMFKLWQENKDTLVGPYIRNGHVEKNRGIYHQRYCDYNMILTGAAFLHKSYLYSYTYTMPETIRKKVDQLTNCEDIAMNFWVAHISRRAPIKATSPRNAWGAQTRGALHYKWGHYRRRNDCIKFLVDIYGYNPLVSTMYQSSALNRRFTSCIKK